MRALNIECDRLFSRRTLLAGAFVAAAGGRPKLARASESVLATTLSRIKVRIKPHPKSDATGVIDSGRMVWVLAGPTPDGWYQVQTADGLSEALGWTGGDGLQFAQNAVLMWDVAVFAGAGEASGRLGWLRHGIVVPVLGPSTDGYTFVKYGALRGYVASAALKVTDQPTTDPLGEWWADVNRSTSTVSLLIGSTVVDTFPASMSAQTGSGFYSTAPGRYWIYEKVAGLQYTPYAKAYIMYWCGFDPYRFNGFHSWTLDANGYVINGGWGTTAGCVATEPVNAAVIYNFLGMNCRVEIHW
jgi:hypothetical protein